MPVDACACMSVHVTDLSHVSACVDACADPARDFRQHKNRMSKFKALKDDTEHLNECLECVFTLEKDWIRQLTIEYRRQN